MQVYRSSIYCLQRVHIFIKVPYLFNSITKYIVQVESACLSSVIAAKLRRAPYYKSELRPPTRTDSSLIHTKRKSRSSKRWNICTNGNLMLRYGSAEAIGTAVGAGGLAAKQHLSIKSISTCSKILMLNKKINSLFKFENMHSF